MTSINNLASTPESTQLHQKEPAIPGFPNEISRYILFLTNDSQKTTVVSHDWNVLTFPVAKESNKYDLERTILLITKALDPVLCHDPVKLAECIADLKEIQDAHQSLTNSVTTCGQIKRLFLISKGLVIGMLRNLTREEKDLLETAIAKDLPDSMKDIFEISGLALWRVYARLYSSHENPVNSDTFFTLLQSCNPLSIKDRGEALFFAIQANNMEFAQMLLANGPISEEAGKKAVVCLYNWYIPNCVELILAILANGLTLLGRGVALCIAARNNNSELAKLILADGPIGEIERGLAVKEAHHINNLELIKLFLANGPIPEDSREYVVERSAYDPTRLETHQLLATPFERIQAEFNRLFVIRSPR